MKRTLSFESSAEIALVLAGTCLIAGTYGLVRLAYGLFLPDIAASLDMPTTTSGLISSGASIAYCLGALVGFSAARRARQIVVAALSTAALGSLGMALAPTVVVFAPAAVVSSMGAGLASPAMVAIIERTVAPRRIDRAHGVVNAGTGPGLAAAGVIALMLLPLWRWGFAISAVLTAAAGVAVLLLDRSAGPGQPPARGETQGRGRAERGFGILLVPAVSALLLGTGSAAVWTFGRTQLIEQGAGDTASTVAWVMLGLGGTAAVVTAGRLARLQPARAWQISAVAVGASTAALALVADRTGVALAACVLFGWGFMAATSALIAWASHLVPGRAAAGTSVLFVVLVLGQAIGSTLTAAVSAGWGLPVALGVAAGMTLLGAAGGDHRVAPRAGSDRGPEPLAVSGTRTIKDDGPMSSAPCLPSIR